MNDQQGIKSDIVASIDDDTFMKYYSNSNKRKKKKTLYRSHSRSSSSSSSRNRDTNPLLMGDNNLSSSRRGRNDKNVIKFSGNNKEQQQQQDDMNQMENTTISNMNQQDVLDDPLLDQDDDDRNSTVMISSASSSLMDGVQNSSNTTTTTTTTTKKQSDDNNNQNQNNNILDPVTYPYGMVGPFEFSSAPYNSNNHQKNKKPILTSSHCANALSNLFQYGMDTFYANNNNINNNNNIDHYDSKMNPFLLTVVVESSSHPTGVDALYAQPYVYAGGGLGNMDECPLATCLAGSNGINHRDSIIFASICIVPECSAYDLISDDFISTVERILLSITLTDTYQYYTGSIQQPEQNRTSNIKNNTIDSAYNNNHSSSTNYVSVKEYEQYMYWVQRQQDLGHEYVTILKHIYEVNHFLQTGWTCGVFIVPFKSWPFGIPYVAIMFIMILLSISGTYLSKKIRRKRNRYNSSTTVTRHNNHHQTMTKNSNENMTTTEMIDVRNDERTPLVHQQQIINNGGACIYNLSILNPVMNENEKSLTREKPSTVLESFWFAFDVDVHVHSLFKSTENNKKKVMIATKFLDGLRACSILWIVLGHAMAIISTSGAGYSNPANFLPPNGITTTIIGQLLFSSRLAVDTFFVISGFLMVYLLNYKMPYNRVVEVNESDDNASRTPYDESIIKQGIIQQSTSARTSLNDHQDAIEDNTLHRQEDVSFLKSILFGFGRYRRNILLLVVSRYIRIVPLYAVCLGFFTVLAPQLGSGPFWHQWIGLLKPCHDYAWTNFLFLNNFIPPNTPVTNTCFYHTWYLAVDMQLYIIAPFFVFVYQINKKYGLRLTFGMFLMSVLTTIYLSYTRQWSINTFDGAAVAKYDIEGYAKPHIRGKAYFAGMFVAMLILLRPPLNVDNNRNNNNNNNKIPIMKKWINRILLTLSFVSMTFVTFVTAFGAYDRRPCNYQESPEHDSCGSLWSPWNTFLYTSLSQTIWVISISILVFLFATPTYTENETRNGCHQQELETTEPGNHYLMKSFLSLSCFTPLSRLSFGVYLIHPIVIFVWQLGDREKQVFRLLTFGMNFLSICIVSFVMALFASVVVELPCASLWKTYTSKKQ